MSVHDCSERTCLRRYLFMAPQSHTLQLRGSSISTDLILGENVSIHMQIAHTSRLQIVTFFCSILNWSNALNC